MWTRKLEVLRVALSCQTIDMRAAGIRKPHHLGALVECLAGSVVDSTSENFHVVVAPNHYQLGVASRYEQAQIRKLGHPVVGLLAHKVCKHVAVKMIHIDNGYA